MVIELSLIPQYDGLTGNVGQYQRLGTGVNTHGYSTGLSLPQGPLLALLEKGADLCCLGPPGLPPPHPFSVICDVTK